MFQSRGYNFDDAQMKNAHISLCQYCRNLFLLCPCWKKKKNGTPLLCKPSHHDPGRVDLLYIMTPGETGFVVEVSVWNVASAKCHNRFGEEDKSPNHILEHLNSPLSLPGWWWFFFCIAAPGICHWEALQHRASSRIMNCCRSVWLNVFWKHY